MKLFLVLLLLVSLLAFTSGRSSKIVNGVTTSTAVHPHQAHLEANVLLIIWSAICGASIIDNRWAITAAHCVEDYSNFRIVVNKGLDSQARVSVSEVIKHPGYKGSYTPADGAYPNDIALLRLASNSVITANNGIGIASSNDGDFSGESCTITGWGLTEGGGSAASVLQQTSGEILSKTGCEALWNEPPESPYKHDLHICIHDILSGACNGDSGGPMVCRGVLAGVTSWGASGCDTTIPTVYTRVSNYYSWIRDETGLPLSAMEVPVPVLY